MTPLAIGALLAVAAIVWAIAPIFGEERGESRREFGGGIFHRRQRAAAEDAIRRWREAQ